MSLLLHIREPRGQGARALENSQKLLSEAKGCLSNCSPCLQPQNLYKPLSGCPAGSYQHKRRLSSAMLTTNAVLLRESAAGNTTVMSLCHKKACSDEGALNFKQWLWVKQVWCNSGRVTKPSPQRTLLNNHINETFWNSRCPEAQTGEPVAANCSLLVRDDGGGKLLVIPSQDALGSFQQRYPAAGFHGLCTLIYHHKIKVIFRKQLQRTIRGST